MMTRRMLFGTALTGVAVAALSRFMGPSPSRAAGKAAGKFEIERTDAEWRALLSPDQYEVLRQEGTERAFSSPLDHEKRKGIFACAGCDLPLFDSATKFDSGTGWPSFWQPLQNAVIEKSDTSWGMIRTAVECRRCGGHLGHVFDDGPQPTGLRYCMNGIAMKFNPAAAEVKG
ncbi:peptide-methionine (R)-S-oxide reductase MsrB [Phyllobacterium sp. 0TCS1.6C]|uniref:peptide-methionine (R)-S-oxide reductase MsrB n=1 Tax=unclassified Phyllobacterium TaxID=2638441 RepID=UPI0022645691|nr:MULTISPECIES: peptide-methionine (R)-S-oxide reductase MsrB [unclassified Phyllobacterium]MCX8281198.1 peptide-methionine (R)-S-oxide reductase MsrB [Phyllobacterium sp. 0TCS1.6C]MCX8294515.1 peptide-methionine (R)-S-oxide reductase MsrB [Phyllobacterium sp. 0TCS1.6A]